MTMSDDANEVTMSDDAYRWIDSASGHNFSIFAPEGVKRLAHRLDHLDPAGSQYPEQRLLDLSKLLDNSTFGRAEVLAKGVFAEFETVEHDNNVLDSL